MRKLIGTAQLVQNFSTGAPPAVYNVEVWADVELIARALGRRALRSKNRYATALQKGILLKEVKP